MTATFHTLLATRLPKAEKAISLLQNLVRYDHTEGEAKDLVSAISDAVDDLDAVFAKKWGWLAPESEEFIRIVNSAPSMIEHVDMPTSVGPIPMLRTDNPTYTYAPRHKLPAGTAGGGASFEAEVRWALDAIQRGDKKLAVNRLKRILNGESHD